MTEYVHLCVADTPTPTLVVRDDRGAAISQLQLPLNTVTDPDAELSAAGWHRSAGWTTTRDGWTAPVIAG